MNNKQCLVSIIIPTYNMESTIIRAVNSCFNQSYKQIEVIIIDDGSIDDTENILKKLINFKIRYFKLNKNYGVSYAKNYGVKKAKGKYICFLDADDSFSKNSVKKRIEFLKNNKSYKVVCGATNYYNFKNKFLFKREVDCLKIRNKTVKDTFLNYSSTSFVTATVMYDRNIFKNVGYFDTNKKINRFEDGDFIYRLLNFYDIGFIKTSVYNYYKGSKSKNLRIYYLFLQLSGKIYTINKHKKGFYKYYLIITNILYFPIKLIHQVFFF